MDDSKKILRGSPSRDEFKNRHKRLCSSLYACDIDFVFVEKVPVPDIIAAIDYKTSLDGLTFAEVIAYNSLVRRGIPVFIVSGVVDTGEFTISRYDGGHHGKPRYSLAKVCSTASWTEFENWEKSLRHNYKSKFSS